MNWLNWKTNMNKLQTILDIIRKANPETMELSFGTFCSRIELWLRKKNLKVNSAISKYSMKLSVKLFLVALQKDNTYVVVHVAKKLSYWLVTLSQVTQNRAVAIYLKQFQNSTRNTVKREELKSMDLEKS